MCPWCQENARDLSPQCPISASAPYAGADLKCSHCDKRFSKKANLLQHEEVHQTLTTRSLLHCPYEGCPRSYTAKRNLKAHVQAFHHGQRFTCPAQDCALTFSTKVSV